MWAGVSISTDPIDRMGVYKRLSEVPSHYRLDQHANTYAGRDVWEEYLSSYLFKRHNSERFKEDARRAGQYWREHVKGRGRHHALATPVDVETWCAGLLGRMGHKTAYNSYWVKLERFYRWLLTHTDHPHVYSPFLMAAADGGAAGEVWEEKIRRGQEETTPYEGGESA